MKKELFEQLVESVRQMKEIEAGTLKPSRVTRGTDVLARGTPDVAALRGRFRLSQAKFAALLGISVDTLQNWEQRRRQPEGPAKVLLRVAAAHPDALLDVAIPSPHRSTRARKREGRRAAA
ncbi:MAG: helix-turn-helix domain-containing protein [Acidobacteriota bacterium]